MFDFVNDSVHPQEVLTSSLIPWCFRLQVSIFTFLVKSFNIDWRDWALCAPAKSSGSVLTRFQTEVHSVSFYFSAGRKIEKQKSKQKQKKNQLQNIHTAEV